MPAVTAVPIQLSYFISDVARAVLFYNRMRWERSTTGVAGLFEPITQPTVTAASLLALRQQPYDVQGKDLELRVGDTEVTVSFVGGSALTAAQVAAQIESATVLLEAVDESGYTRISTVQTGLDTTIEVLGGDAAAYLGFTVGLVAFGAGADLALSGSVSEYFLTDPNSDAGYWYRVTLLNTSTGESSLPSPAFPADAVRRVPFEKTVVCYLDLCDLSGAPLPERLVTLANVAGVNTITDPSTNVFRHFASRSTDRNGHLEIRVLRGITVDLSIEGTGFTRRITIPSDTDTVNLLDPALVISDEFGIQEPRIRYAERLS